MLENQNLHMRLENLECAFVGTTGIREEAGSQISADYTISSLVN